MVGGSSSCQTSCHLLRIYTQGQGQTEAALQVEPSCPHSLLGVTPLSPSICLPLLLQVLWVLGPPKESHEPHQVIPDVASLQSSSGPACMKRSRACSRSGASLRDCSREGSQTSSFRVGGRTLVHGPQQPQCPGLPCCEPLGLLQLWDAQAMRGRMPVLAGSSQSRTGSPGLGTTSSLPLWVLQPVLRGLLVLLLVLAGGCAWRSTGLRGALQRGLG